MFSVINKIRERVAAFLPKESFFFGRPLVLLQSDDWGRVGLRDREGLEELRAAGFALGERPYDLYTLETADDVQALCTSLSKHRDASGRSPVVVMNFLTANLNFPKTLETGQLDFVPLASGLPQGWSRPRLFDAYRQGIASGLLYPALHGVSHFCKRSVERHVRKDDERGMLLRTLWKAGTPYIHWRMPWIGYEYWDPEQSPENRFVGMAEQAAAIGHAVGMFTNMFHTMPRSACAPGYRANVHTNRAWSQNGIRCAQNGPTSPTPPYFDRYEILQLHRAVEFEPATDEGLSIEPVLQQADACFAAGVPVIVSVHSINFHSTVREFRSRTLDLLDQFLTALKAKHPDLLYVHDEDLYQIVQTGSYESAAGRTRVQVKTQRFRSAALSS
jgi:hypothetical protein